MFQRSLISSEEEEWQFETAKWVLSNLSDIDRIRKTPLVLPTKDFFPTNHENGHDLALVLFDHVKASAGMSEWPCKLEAQETLPPRQIAEFVHQVFEKEVPLGTFHAAGDDQDQIPIVTYNVELLQDPVQFIATCAHELAHYLMMAAKEPPPLGWDVHEEATDFLAVFMGFGIFLANTAFDFRQHGDSISIGWRISGGGYLKEPALIYALSLFLRMKNEPIDVAIQHLKPHLASALKKADKLQRKDLRLQALIV
jgi:hypothetical protein